MRYFTRRYSTLRWLVLRPFASLRCDQECIQHPCQEESPGHEWDTLVSLLFIDAVRELRHIVDKLSESSWVEFIERWRMEHHVKLLMVALQSECGSSTGLSGIPAVCCDELKGAAKEEVGEGYDGLCWGSRLPRSVLTLLSCTAFLCLHVDQPLVAISLADVCATYHCLCVAAIAEEENCRRRTILQAWGKEFDALQHLERQGVARVALQHQERLQREIVVLHEFSTWMRLAQSACSRSPPRGQNYFGVLVPSSLHLHSLILHEDFFSTSSEGVLLPSPSPRVAMAAAAAQASFSQSTLPWRRDGMQQRLKAFFGRMSAHQQRDKVGPEVGRAVSLPQAWGCSRIYPKE
ncbi:hypothetical protein TraAM80_08266 [Trypanosoma rangeli]|uniref:Uncharacterized protein n=1 Tax=Trypanosoma rangeli TaxID=5698 RepID=A0A422N1F7_TRYRA|nr:uncharacterized protein TraAM80_08266 [Trypanosoma rangeli]RNE99297.1 hypothetical protein TraAM80_08266 [Trypanosoma rangeli]|eukprot:RNE99297.1 hypothetical protein TraAM80_08266 [Trypanosoma rangeli]